MRSKSESGIDTRPEAAAEPVRERLERRPYRKPVPELRGQIKPSLLGSPPPPPVRIIRW